MSVASATVVAPVAPVDASGWLHGACVVHSPNADPRPDGVLPTLLVIHNISLPPGCFGARDITALFTNTLDFDAHPFYQTIRGLRVSSHFLIARDGGLTQFVSTLERAWHAGASCFAGRERCNDFSIGVELEGTDDRAFAAPQYATLASLTKSLRARHPIGAVAGHADIAPGRKTDPGPYFDWNAYGEAAALPGHVLPRQAA
ncbi:MAG: 1,6-anhydro-N-acetylmuramyl-L-alanine amidase AmpD [Janthinobacterium lividum]